MPTINAKIFRFRDNKQLSFEILISICAIFAARTTKFDRHFPHTHKHKYYIQVFILLFNFVIRDFHRSKTCSYFHSMHRNVRFGNIHKAKRPAFKCSSFFYVGAHSHFGSSSAVDCCSNCSLKAFSGGLNTEMNTEH